VTPPAPHLTLVVPTSVSAVVQPAPDLCAPANADPPSFGVVLLLDVLVRIEQRRQTRLRMLQTKAAS